MVQIVKTIKGCKYTYDVKWNPERKKQVWTYLGKEEKRIDLEKLKGEIYCSITRHVKIQKKDRKKIMKAIQVALTKYNNYW